MGRLLVVRREVGVVDDAVVGIVTSVVGTVMIVIVGRVIVSDVGGAVVDDELGVDDGLVDELEVGEDAEDEVDVERVEVDPESVRMPTPAVTRLLRSTVTSGNGTMLVPGMVLGSWAAVEEGKTSVRVSPPGLIT